MTQLITNTFTKYCGICTVYGIHLEKSIHYKSIYIEARIESQNKFIATLYTLANKIFLSFPILYSNHGDTSDPTSVPIWVRVYSDSNKLNMIGQCVYIFDKNTDMDKQIRLNIGSGIGSLSLKVTSNSDFSDFDSNIISESKNQDILIENEDEDIPLLVPDSKKSVLLLGHDSSYFS